MMRLKKSLGQHFLKDEQIVLKIVNVVKKLPDMPIYEIGPGAGALTKYFLLKKDYKVIEIDKNWVYFLSETFSELKDRIICNDFLKINIRETVHAPSAIIGNFPYNISSQILFKILENDQHILFVVGMFQKEVAKRIAAEPGSDNSVLSILVQAQYTVEYLFEIPPEAFTPPPKVWSAVIRLRKRKHKPAYDTMLFKRIVKTAFGQRRKKLSNSLKVFLKDERMKQLPILSKRPEHLSVDAFINLTERLSD